MFYFYFKSALDPTSALKLRFWILYRNCIWRGNIRKLETFFVYQALHNQLPLLGILVEFVLNPFQISIKFEPRDSNLNLNSFRPNIIKGTFTIEHFNIKSFITKRVNSLSYLSTKGKIVNICKPDGRWQFKRFYPLHLSTNIKVFCAWSVNVHAKFTQR